MVCFVLSCVMYCHVFFHDEGHGVVEEGKEMSTHLNVKDKNVSLRHYCFILHGLVLSKATAEVD